MNSLTFDILSFLESTKGKVFSRFEEKIMAFSEPIAESLFKNEGRLFFGILAHSISLSGEELNDYLQETATKVVENQVQEDSVIEFFVYNVNMVKTELFSEIFLYPTINEDSLQIFGKIAHIIDQFLYFSITSMYKRKHRLIAEKNRYLHNSHEERLTVLGQMTSSFVHEFRNPLTTVHGFIQLLRAEHPELPYLDIISAELEQLKYRITQFLMLSKREFSETEMTAFSINNLLDQIAAFIYPRLLEVSVELKLELEGELIIKGKREEIRQVLINIIFNALEVLSSNEYESIIHIRGYTNNHQVFIETSNCGPKIPDDLLNNIFEPFVTNKKSGTGLGLYVSREIIENHNGQLLCESNEALTTFTIIVPSAETDI